MSILPRELSHRQKVLADPVQYFVALGRVAEHQCQAYATTAFTNLLQSPGGECRLSTGLVPQEGSSALGKWQLQFIGASAEMMQDLSGKKFLQVLAGNLQARGASTRV